MRSPTDLVFAIPRIQMDDTAEDRKAVQPLVSQVVMYLLSPAPTKAMSACGTKRTS